MSTTSNSIIFTHEELKLKRNVGVLLVLDELRECGKDNGTQITIPIECYQRAMQGRWAPDLLDGKKRAGPPSDGKTRMQRDGPRLWAELHTMALTVCLDTPADLKTAQQRFQIWSGLISCGSCAGDWKTYLAEFPPDFSSNEAFFTWTVAAHNVVNAKLNKAMVTLEQARERWSANNPA